MGLLDQSVMDLLQSLQRQLAASYAIGTGVIGRSFAAGRRRQGLSLADGFAAGGADLSDLPQECPEDQAKVPQAVARMGPVVLLGQSKARDVVGQEGFELMEGGAQGGAKPMDLSGS